MRRIKDSFFINSQFPITTAIDLAANVLQDMLKFNKTSLRSSIILSPPRGRNAPINITTNLAIWFSSYSPA